MSAAPPLLFLSEAEVTAALSMREAIATNRAAFAALARGDCVVPSRLHIPTPENQGVTLFKPALSGDALGCKIVSVRPNNAELGLPTVPSVMILVDKTTAMPRAVMGGVQLTGLRTAAGSGAATASMAREDVARLVVFGAGLQGREHVKAMLEVRPSLKHVVVVNRSEPRAAALVRQLGESFDGVEFEVVLTADQEGVEAAVRAADIICTGTNASEPLFDGKLVPKGCHINCVGSYKPNMQEIDEELVARCTTIAVDCAGAKASSGDLAVPIASGRVQADDMLELGSIFVQEDEGTPFKRGADDITLFKSVGVGIQDILTADKVVSAAQARGLGTTLSL